MRWGWLVVALLVTPIVEIAVIVQVGHQIGVGWTLALLVAESLLGAWLVKREGRHAWQALRTAMSTGRLPGRELTDAALVLIGGTLLLTPGFVTDLVGFFFVLPFTRPLARRAMQSWLARRAVSSLTGSTGRTGQPARGASAGPQTVPGEVLDD